MWREARPSSVLTMCAQREDFLELREKVDPHFSRRSGEPPGFGSSSTTTPFSSSMRCASACRLRRARQRQRHLRGATAHFRVRLPAPARGRYRTACGCTRSRASGAVIAPFSTQPSPSAPAVVRVKHVELGDVTLAPSGLCKEHEAVYLVQTNSTLTTAVRGRCGWCERASAAASAAMGGKPGHDIRRAPKWRKNWGGWRVLYARAGLRRHGGSQPPSAGSGPGCLRSPRPPPLPPVRPPPPPPPTRRPPTRPSTAAASCAETSPMLMVGGGAQGGGRARHGVVRGPPRRPCAPSHRRGRCPVRLLPRCCNHHSRAVRRGHGRGRWHPGQLRRGARPSDPQMVADLHMRNQWQQ